MGRIDGPVVGGVVPPELSALSEGPGTDPLTGVADRASFLRRLDEAASGPQPGVLVIDLDDFTAVPQPAAAIPLFPANEGPATTPLA